MFSVVQTLLLCLAVTCQGGSRVFGEEMVVILAGNASCESTRAASGG